jgi:ribosomal protein L13E
MSEKAAKKKKVKKTRAKPAAKKKKIAHKAHAKAEEEVKVESAPVVETEPSPQAVVMARHEYSSQERRGKGFSFGELSAAGLTLIVAKSLSVPVDIRRRSVLEGNVGALKGWYKPAPKKAKEPKPEKVKAEKPAKKKEKKKVKKAKKEGTKA